MHLHSRLAEKPFLAALQDPNGDGDTSDSVADDTIVIFQSDNGGPGGKNLGEFDANGGLRAVKGRIEEGGIRTPLMIRLADLYYAACLVLEADWELVEKQDRIKQRLALLFLQRRALGREPKSIAYYDDLVARLALER